MSNKKNTESTKLKDKYNIVGLPEGFLQRFNMIDAQGEKSLLRKKVYDACWDEDYNLAAKLLGLKPDISWEEPIFTKESFINKFLEEFPDPFLRRYEMLNLPIKTKIDNVLFMGDIRRAFEILKFHSINQEEL